ncbi:cytochrome P450 [Planomonospora venezuelensis]|uniref:Cytochrome P450 n=1 Tax=Planomonospora venezuelensis TaxID=1999 RepID=A0A841D824_PLAVE|nr:cytochrome P450 [Planomonospora venezuelensis]MBB5966090.1 cytochrome P450 [Planomonospora venezuelensis]GIN03597.1 cytochrome P450 [Planomonospora venezuelensis]
MGRIARVSAMDGLRLGATVLAPVVAQGVIVRRPRMTALAQALDTDRRAVRLLHRMRAKYGGGPLLVPIPLRPMLLVLDPEDVQRILAGTPEPFAADNREKRSALGHFEPDAVLVSHGRLREDRRRFNEAVLETGQDAHRFSGAFQAVIRQELGPPARAPELTWERFAPAWWRAVRRIVLGDGARDDTVLTDLLNRLRADANWAYARPRRRGTYRRFTSRLRAHLDRAEPGSLAALAARTPASDRTRPEGQVPHWLFAFDAAGIAVFRALALLATHPEHEERARAESAGAPGGGRDGAGGGTGTAAARPFLAACVQESLRLWPTTLAILRDSTTATHWGGGTVPGQTPFLVFSAFVNRDEETGPSANRFTPRIWLDGAADDRWSIVPFSRGPAQCAGRNLVLDVTTGALAALLAQGRFRVEPPTALAPGRDLPYSLDHFTLRFAVRQLEAVEGLGGRSLQDRAVHAEP